MENNINLIGICGKKNSGKNTIAKMIQALTAGYKNTVIIDMLNSTQYKSSLMLEDTVWEVKAFADKVKQVASILTGISVEKFENRSFKDNEELEEEWWKYHVQYETKKVVERTDWRSKTKDVTMNSQTFDSYEEAKIFADNVLPYEELEPDPKIITTKLTPRTILQKIGTDCMRNNLHPNTWINALFADYKEQHFRTVKDINGIVIDHTAILPNWIITDCRFLNEAKSIKKRGGIIIKLTRNSSSEDNHCSEKEVELIEANYIIDNNNQKLEETLKEVQSVLKKLKVIY